VKFLQEDPPVWDGKYQGEIPVCSVAFLVVWETCGTGCKVLITEVVLRMQLCLKQLSFGMSLIQLASYLGTQAQRQMIGNISLVQQNFWEHP